MRAIVLKTLAAATVAVMVMAAGAAAQTSVIKINTFDDLRKIGTVASYPRNGNYELAADIDASSSRSQAFLPIGDTTVPFSGTFDGKKHVISGLYINRPESQDVGLFGVAQNAEIKDVILLADSIIGEITVGALVGQAVSTVIKNCHTKGYVGGKASVGGLAGYAGGATITNSDSHSDCNASGGGWGSVGGLVGHAGDGTVITASYATGNVTSTSNNVGGLIGYSKGVNINKCYSTGNVSGEHFVGGFIGLADNGYEDTISNCYSTGNVSRSTNVGSDEGIGGFAGAIFSSYTVIIHCYSNGRVGISGGRYGIGGFWGAYYSVEQAINCFWDIETSNQSDTAASGDWRGHVTGKTTAEMKQKATFTNWDFETIWTISEGLDYPKLRGSIGFFRDLIYVAGVGGRIVGASWQAIAPGSDGSKVVAVADAGYVFVKWSDGVTGSERIDRNVANSIHVTANFAPADPRVLSYSADNGGTIRGQASQTIPAGGNGSAVEAVPDSGYVFAEWSDGVKTAARTDQNVQSNIAVTAAFAKVYTLRYIAGTGGRIVGAPTQNVLPGSAGTTVNAVANNGYAFVSWSDGKTTAKRTDENVTADISVTANFAQIQYTLHYKLGTGGREIIGIPEQTVLPGSSGAEVYVLAETGYTFARWSDGSTDNPRTDTNIRSDITVTAYFADPNGTVSVLTPERVIPPPPPKEEAAVIAPVTVLSGEFTAGPNPVGRSSGGIAFFRQGKRVSGTLSVYDATGNVIKKITVKDNALNNQSRRNVGKWDLTDKKGRQVSEGTYLLKGVVKTSDGKSEKVSVIFGVR